MDHGAENYEKYLAGDDSGMVDIIRDYKDSLIFFLMRYVKSTHIAEELCEDTFFRIATRKPRFRSGNSFKTWLFTIGRNAAVNYLRHESRSSAFGLEVAEAASSDELEQSYLKEEQKRILHGALSKIKVEYSLVLHLKFFEELTNAQIASVMKKSSRQVENLLYQAKRSLKAELEKEGFIYENL